MVTMKKKLTLLIFDAAGTPVRQATIPRMLLPMTVLLLLAASIALYLGISDYLRLKTEAKDVHHLRSNLRTQAERVVQQQNQIIDFSNKINFLNTKLADLHDFEQKIRIIANLETGNDGSSIFGVGGSDPEDLDPVMIIEQDYQELVRDMHAEIDEIDQASHKQHNSFS